MKKITVLINTIRVCRGAETVCITVSNALFERGWDVTFVTLDIRSKKNTGKLNQGIKKHILNTNYAITSFFSVWRWLLKNKPENVLVFNFQTSAMLIILRIISKLKFRIISRNMNILSRKKNEKKHILKWHIMHNLSAFFIRYADTIIAQSEEMKNDLLINYGIDISKIYVINNPVQKKIENYFLNNKISAQKHGNYILCIGRLVPQKAFHYAIKAFSLITNDYPSLRLKIFGEGRLENELKQLSFDLKINDKISFNGFCEDLIPYYLNARLTLLTSSYEGFPNVLLESIALGTPVVSFNCISGPSKIVKDNINGYLARPDDINHLVECIKRALNREWDSEIIIKTAEKFSSVNIIKKYEDILQKY